MSTESFEERKSAAWQRLWEDLEIGYLDTDILDVLIEFFLRPKSFTKSSCSGRITIIDAEYPWAKDETMTIFKKHNVVAEHEVKEVILKPHNSNLWLSVQGPIYHVYVKDLEEAEEVLRAAREAGFKHSGVMVLGQPPLVELRTGVRADILLATPDTIIVDMEKLSYIVTIANKVLIQAKERNRRLLEALRRRRPSELWGPALEKAKSMKLL